MALSFTPRAIGKDKFGVWWSSRVTWKQRNARISWWQLCSKRPSLRLKSALPVPATDTVNWEIKNFMCVFSDVWPLCLILHDIWAVIFLLKENLKSWMSFKSISKNCTRFWCLSDDIPMTKFLLLIWRKEGFLVIPRHGTKLWLSVSCAKIHVSFPEEDWKFSHHGWWPGNEQQL